MKFILFILFISFSFTSCAAIFGKNKRGTLSEASEKASDNYKGERKIISEEDDDSSSLETDSVDFIQNGPYKNPDQYSTPEASATTFYYEHLQPTTSFLNRTNHAYISFDLINLESVEKESIIKRTDLGINFGFNKHRFNHQTKLVNAWENINSYNMGLHARFFYTPKHTFFDLYSSLNLRYSLLTWDYKNSFRVDHDTVEWDMLDGFNIGLGVGTTLIKTTHIKIGAELGYSGTAWGDKTQEGFENDVFELIGFVSYKILFSISL